MGGLRCRGGRCSAIATVYSYKSENGGKWVEEPFTMAEAKFFHVAMRIKPSAFNCTGKHA